MRETVRASPLTLLILVDIESDINVSFEADPFGTQVDNYVST